VITTPSITNKPPLEPLIEEEVEIDIEDDEKLKSLSTSNTNNLSNMNISTLSHTVNHETQKHPNDGRESQTVTNTSKELICESCSLTFRSKQEKDTHFSNSHSNQNHHQNNEIVQKMSISNSESGSNQTMNKVE
jgi:hypothetical protein